MNVANVLLTIYRKPECVDKFGKNLKTCKYEVIGQIYCARTYKNRSSGQQLLEIQENVEYLNFLWHSCDQPAFINIEKNDYFAFTMAGEKHFYLVKRTEGRPAFRFGKGNDVISYKTIGERKTPRECPKEIFSQYGSDELDVIPSV